MAGIFTITTSGGMKAGGAASRTIVPGGTRSAWLAAYSATTIWLNQNGKFSRHRIVGIGTDDWNDKYFHCSTRDIFYGDDIYTPGDYASLLGFIDSLETREQYNRMLNDLR